MFRSRKTLSIAFVSVLAGLVSLAMLGCEDIGDGAPSAETTLLPVTTATDSAVSTDTSAPATTAPPTTAPPATTATTLASTEEVMPDGTIRTMGYIEDVWVDGGVRKLKIDYCEFVHGEEATEAARADGEIGPTEEWDLDFYIRNQSSKLRTWRISDSVVITTATRWAPHDGFEAPCSWSDFLSFWGPGPFADVDGVLHSLPWWINRDGDTVVRIEEQYLP